MIYTVAFDPIKILTYFALQNDRQNLSFVKDVNVCGQKMTKNGCKLAKRKSCQFFKSPVFTSKCELHLWVHILSYIVVFIYRGAGKKVPA